MPPRIEEYETVLTNRQKQENIDQIQEQVIPSAPVVAPVKKENENVDLPIVWKNVAIFIALHLGALYGVYLCFYAKLPTLIFGFIMYVLGGLGITGGAHRLWAHKTYKAKLPLRIFLAFCQSVALQNSIFEWCRDHRVHHKHAETNADPHNAKRGFFFSHMGWLMMRKHPLVFEKGSRIPLDDLLADPVVYYQRKYYKSIAIFCCFVFPTIAPMILWGESFTVAYFVPAILRYVWTLHITWLVNSVAHMWGWKPYDKRINPVENLFVSLGAIGEGFHNYHHTFPQDYATSEYGAAYLNFTKGFIDAMAFIGQAYDRKKMSEETVLNRRKRTGDLSELEHREHDESHEHDY